LKAINFERDGARSELVNIKRKLEDATNTNDLRDEKRTSMTCEVNFEDDLKALKIGG
jgi:hypothetical protein